MERTAFVAATAPLLRRRFAARPALPHRATPRRPRPPAMRLRTRAALPALALAVLLSAAPGRAAALPAAPHASAASAASAPVMPARPGAAFAAPLRVAAAPAGVAPAPASLGERVAQRLKGTGLSDELIVVAVSALPVVELRAGVPIGIALFALPPLTVFALAVFGNMIPVALLLPLLQLRLVQRLAAPVLSRARAKASALASSKSLFTALALFVGVPMPGTGAFTGCLVSFVLNMGVVEAWWSIAAGVVMSAAIMTILSVAGRTGALFALTAMLAIGVSSIVSSRNAAAAARQGSGPSPDRSPVREDSGQ
jgi:uncharacterized membrane protein